MSLRKLEPRLNRRKIEGKDILYLILFCLVILGFLDSATRFVHTTVISPIKEVFIKDTQAYNKKTNTEIKIQFEDKRINRLYTFLESKQSPLVSHAGYIIKESDEKGIDWTLMVAIAGKESEYGKYMPNGSHNAWGIGGKSGFYYFSSWEEGISYEAQLLSNHYRYDANKGIQKKYCPTEECSPTWAQDVSSFSQEILANR